MKSIVYVENKYFVAVTHNGFKLTNLETKEKHYLSFEDVEILIFDNSQCYLSAKVIEKCADNKIGLLFVIAVICRYLCWSQYMVSRIVSNG